MSRRDRRKAALAKKTAKPWLVRSAVAAFVGLTVAAGGGYMVLRGWLHGEGFRRMLAVEAGKALKVTADFAPFRWSGASMDTERFSANGEGIVRSIEAEGLRVDVGLGGWWQGVWRIEDARARRIEVVVDTTVASGKSDTGAVETPPTPEAPRGKKWYDSLVPQEVEVRQVEVGQSSLSVVTRSGPVGISGTAWKLVPDVAKGSYRAEGTGGTVRVQWSWAPPMALGRARLRYHADTVSLSSADFQVYDSGRLDLTGEMSVKGNGYGFDGRLADVRCSEVLPEDWKQRLSGVIRTEFSADKGTGGPRVKGHLVLENGVLTALPLLDALSAYADTSRFRLLALQEAQTDYEWEQQTVVLRNLVLSSEGLVRLEGTFRMAPEKRIDGRFRLGLMPGVLARIPGAETKVFSPGERGLLWTPLHVTGTLDDPEEDLTGRLIEAAGMRMIEIIPETGEKVLKFSREVLDEDMQKQLKATADDVIDQSRDLIRDAEDTAKEVKGLLDDILGE